MRSYLGAHLNISEHIKRDKARLFPPPALRLCLRHLERPAIKIFPLSGWVLDGTSLTYLETFGMNWAAWF